MTDVIDLFDNARGAWAVNFGTWDPPKNLPSNGPVSAVSGVTAPSGAHAEAQFSKVLGADFEYSATIIMPLLLAADLDVHLQFRISDEGRYGIGIKAGQLRLYKFVRADRPCNIDNSADFAHCPSWPDSDGDLPVFQQLGTTTPIDAGPGKTVTVRIVAQGSELTVFGGQVPIVQPDQFDLPVGRFGLYAISQSGALNVTYSDIHATTSTWAKSNFTLLFSTVGYDADRSKRALLRTLNDVPVQGMANLQLTFSLIDPHGHTAFGEAPLVPVGSTSGRTLGFQAWVADFTGLTAPGTYTIVASVSTPNGDFQLSSEAIVIGPALLTERLVKPLSMLNALARRAADDDFRRNWQIESGASAWSVGVDGAFIADRADDGAGATMHRFFNIGNEPMTACEFRYFARVTIVEGCDAQLQFWINDAGRWAVTLQAGAAGGCPHGGGPGAVRLDQELIHPPQGVPNVNAVKAVFFAPGDFRIGVPYDVEIRVRGSQIVVLVDSADSATVQMRLDYTAPANAPVCGQFGLKAWGSTARFERVQAWWRDVAISYPERGNGVWIPYFTALSPPPPPLPNGPDLMNKSPQNIAVSPFFDTDPTRKQLTNSPQNTSYPFFVQSTGFFDCNNYIGEATSHGVFLAGLMDVWSRRAGIFGANELEALRDAIVTAVLYLFGLFEQGNFSGEFAHQEPGRGAMAPGDQIGMTGCAIYGLSSFAELGGCVDASLAKQALQLSEEGLTWMNTRDLADPSLQSIVLARMAAAADWQGDARAARFRAAAVNAADQVLSTYSQNEAMAEAERFCLRSIPWFEGVYEVVTRGWAPLDQNNRTTQLDLIATQLQSLMDDPANALHIMPQASGGDVEMRLDNWSQIDELPTAHAAIPDPPDGPVGDWYVCEHFAVAALDCACIAKLTSGRDLEPLATGNLNWILGLNPGLPASKTVLRDKTVDCDASAAVSPWRAASYLYNGPGAFARTIEGNRSITKSSKGWRADWECCPSSRHRETWWIDPLGNGFQSIVNGHLLSDGQWAYWSDGVAGWVSGETFMLIDGSFLKAAIALEDWGPAPIQPQTNPYNIHEVTFLNTTHTDRFGTNWAFDDPDHVGHAFAARTVHQIGQDKGFRSARATGHYLGERVGALAIPIDADLFLVSSDEVITSPWPFTDIETSPWAQVSRAATELAAGRHYSGGFFTGNAQRDSTGHPTAYELVGLHDPVAAGFDATDAEIAASPWAFTDINAVSWAQAARVATGVAIAHGFAGGFFTGHQIPDKRGIIGLRP